MNATLNINRLGLLLKRYFTENKQRELTFWGIVTVVFALMHLAGSNEKDISVQLFLYISGFIFAARSFKFFNFTPSGMHYLLIPATHLEKVTTSILLSIFYYFAMILLTYTVGTILGTTIGNAVFNLNNPIQFELFQSPEYNYVINNGIHTSYKSGPGLLNMFIAFAGIQSVFILGSIYFKGNAIAKTILSIFGFAILLGIIEAILLKITFGSYHLDGQAINLSFSSVQNTSTVLEIVSTIIKYALIPFFWVVTYFRLTEKEV